MDFQSWNSWAARLPTRKASTNNVIFMFFFQQPNWRKNKFFWIISSYAYFLLKSTSNQTTLLRAKNYLIGPLFGVYSLNFPGNSKLLVIFYNYVAKIFIQFFDYICYVLFSLYTRGHCNLFPNDVFSRRLFFDEKMSFS